MAVKGIPGKLTMNADVEPDVEAFDNPHENLDDAQRDRQDTEVEDSRMDNSARIGGDAGVQVMDRQIRITKTKISSGMATRPSVLDVLIWRLEFRSRIDTILISVVSEST